LVTGKSRPFTPACTLPNERLPDDALGLSEDDLRWRRGVHDYRAGSHGELTPTRGLALDLRCSELVLAGRKKRRLALEHKREIRPGKESAERPHERRAHPHPVAPGIDGEVPPPPLDDDETAPRTRPLEVKPAPQEEVEPVVPEKSKRERVSMQRPFVRLRIGPRIGSAQKSARMREQAGAPMHMKHGVDFRTKVVDKALREGRLARSVRPRD
jgi:hypothetical protein